MHWTKQLSGPRQAFFMTLVSVWFNNIVLTLFLLMWLECYLKTWYIFLKTGSASVMDFVLGLRLQIWLGMAQKWHPDTHLRYPTSVKLAPFLFRHFSCMNITRCIAGPSFWVPVTFTIMFRTALSSSQACLFEDMSQMMTLIKHLTPRSTKLSISNF